MMVKGWVDKWEMDSPFESQFFISVWEGEENTNSPSLPVIIFEAEKVEEVVNILKPLANPDRGEYLSDFSRFIIQKALAILEGE